MTAVARRPAPWLVSGALHASVLAGAAAIGAGGEPVRVRQAPPIAVVLLSAAAGVIYQPVAVRQAGAGAPGSEAAGPPAARPSERPRSERQRSRAHRFHDAEPSRARAQIPPEVAHVGRSDEPAARGPASPAPSAGGGGTAAGERARVLSAYLETVLGPINAHTTYPEEAERLGLEGRFVVRIAVDGSGRLLEAQLVGAEPHVLLKRSAFAALAASAPLPPPPAELGPLVRVDVPFVYRLDG